MIKMLFRLAGNLVSPAGSRARLAILIYHRVLAAPDPMMDGEIDAAGFDAHMALLAAEFNVLPLAEACERLSRGALPARAVSITFDDGYANNEEIALPILKRYGLRAAFFVSTGYSAGGMMFNDTIIEALRGAPSGFHDLSALRLGKLEIDDLASRRTAVDRLITALKYRPVAERQRIVERLADIVHARVGTKLMMTPQQIAKLHREGMEIGAHTVTHPILSSIADDQARAEIVQSKRTLEEITGSAVTLFAYPNGKPPADYDGRHVRLVREAGFAAAVSTIPGVAHRDSDFFQLPRFGPWGRDTRRLAMRLLLSCVRAAGAHPIRHLQTQDA
jgi:peptidoglycan/xylan/chitin deacetylase (PgdA/CDA1 family)